MLEKLRSLGGEARFDLQSFETLLLFALKSVKVETIPTYIDAVYVGLATESYFSDVPTLFVLGANAAAIPSLQADTGIIADADIKKLSLNFALEPEIKVLNRRKRLKLFELLQHAKEQLVVCSPLNVDGAHQDPSEFVDDLATLFGKNTLHSDAFEVFDSPLFSAEQTLSRLLIQLGNRQNLMSAYTKLRGKMPKQYVSAVRACIKADLPVEFRYQYLTTPHFPYKKTISASELECYFRCPYRHFLQYGLGVKEKENILPQKSNFGSFEHELLQKFVSGRDLRAAKEQDVENFIVQTFEDIAGKYYDKKILSQKQFVKYLKNESRLILKNVVYEQKNSDFRPILLEKEILLPISDNLLLKGFVDRVDRCGDYFRILDYKTGQTGSVKNDLFYGKKLQLLLYAGAQWKELGLDCAGVYYFDCQTKYAGLGSSKKLFKGLTKQDENVLFKSDTRLFDEEFKSDILGVSRKAHPKKGEFPYKGGNLEENLSSLVKYAYDVSKLAISEMTDGFVGAKPFTGACTHCPYLSVCRHGKADGKRGALKKKSKDAREEDVQ